MVLLILIVVFVFDNISNALRSRLINPQADRVNSRLTRETRKPARAAVAIMTKYDSLTPNVFACHGTARSLPHLLPQFTR